MHPCRRQDSDATRQYEAVRSQRVPGRNGEWKIGETDAYEVTIPGTEGSARGTFVDMGNPHVVAVIEDAFASLPVVESLDLVTKPVVAPRSESDENVEFVRVDDIDQSTGVGEATMRVNERGCGETLSCGTGLCATGIVLQAKTGISHWGSPYVAAPCAWTSPTAT